MKLFCEEKMKDRGERGEGKWWVKVKTFSLIRIRVSGIRN